MSKIYVHSSRFMLLLLLIIIAAVTPTPVRAQDAPGADYPHNCGIKETPRKLTFSGKRWNVKQGKNLGPNSNEFSASPSNVWLDDNGFLHLRMRRQVTPDGKTTWWSAEVCQTGVTGYGMHRFEVRGLIDRLNPNVVLGLFLYEVYNEGKVDEIDIEFARWSDKFAPNGQYVVQPYDAEGNMHRFNFALTNPQSTHYFDWCPEGVQFKSIKGFRPEPNTPGQLIQSWTYTGADNPLDSVPLRLHLNLWITDTPNFKPTPQERKNGIEVVIRSVDTDKTPNVPVITLPAKGAEVSPQPSFAWGDTDAANAYTFQLTTAADTDFATPIINEALLPNENAVLLSFTPQSPLTPGDYLWRVSSFCGATVSDWSETRAVTVVAEP